MHELLNERPRLVKLLLGRHRLEGEAEEEGEEGEEEFHFRSWSSELELESGGLGARGQGSGVSAQELGAGSGWSSGEKSICNARASLAAVRKEKLMSWRSTLVM